MNDHTSHPSSPPSLWHSILLFAGVGFSTFFLLTLAGYLWFQFMGYTYQQKIFPNVTINDIPFTGKTFEDVKAYVLAQNKQLDQAVYELHADTQIATLSASNLDISYDATLAAIQAYSVGRTGRFFSDLVQRFLQKPIRITPLLRSDTTLLDATLESLADDVDIPMQNALFELKNGKVTSFQVSKPGRQLNKTAAKQRIEDLYVVKTKQNPVIVNLPIDTVNPTIATDQVNTLGIKEKIGVGYSEYQGSIPGRLHNVALAASKFHGVLIPPGATFSVVDILGDISAQTGYQAAYIIKDGHTILGDGGGVCQVSTTLFRAALAAGLPIIERHAHDYRVHYYEEGGFKAGIDATVFAPSVDLKFKNDTPASILIQTTINPSVPSLTMEFYGTSDGRTSKITNQTLSGITPPPPDLYQDDPTLPAGQVKQIDFSAWGANASFEYTVTRAGETITHNVFKSNYRPWQAVYLRGTKS